MRALPCLVRSALLLVVVGASLAVGCDEPNTLTGSISESHDLSFDSVELRLLTDQQALELRYLKALDSGDNDIVAKIVVDVPEGGVSVDEEIDLLEHNGAVDRVTARNDPFPALDRGSLTITSGGVDDGEDSVGDFASTFVNGKTLNGTFAVPLEHVSFE